jgi:hypothetical protein
MAKAAWTGSGVPEHRSQAALQINSPVSIKLLSNPLEILQALCLGQYLEDLKLRFVDVLRGVTHPQITSKYYPIIQGLSLRSG